MVGITMSSSSFRGAVEVAMAEDQRKRESEECVCVCVGRGSGDVRFMCLLKGKKMSGCGGMAERVGVPCGMSLTRFSSFLFCYYLPVYNK